MPFGDVEKAQDLTWSKAKLPMRMRNFSLSA